MSEIIYDMSPEERRELVAEFLSESEGHLQALNDSLLRSEHAVAANTAIPEATLNAMFRAAHTIKGTASFIGFTKIVQITHEMETLLQKVRGQEITLTPDMVDVLFSALDAVAVLFESLRTYNEERGEIKECVQRIQGLLTGGGAAAAAVEKTAAEPSGAAPLPAAPASTPNPGPVVRAYIDEYVAETEQNISNFNETLLLLERAGGSSGQAAELVSELFRIVHTIKGSSGLVHVQPAAEIAHRMESIMALTRDRRAALDGVAISLLFEAIDTIKDILIELKKGGRLTIDVDSLCRRLDECSHRVKSAVPADAGQPAVVSVEELRRNVMPERLTPAESLLYEKAAAQNLPVGVMVLELEQGIPLKSMKAFLLDQRCAGIGSVIATRPDMDTLDRRGEQATFYVVLLATTAAEAAVRAAVCVDGAQLISWERVAGEQKAAVMKKEEARVEAVHNNDREPGAGVTAIETSTIRIDARKLDILMNLSGELVIARAQFARLVTLFEKDVHAQRGAAQQVKEARGSADRLNQEIKAICGGAAGSNNEMTARMQKELEDLFGRLQTLEATVSRTDLLNRIRMLDETTGALGKISSDIQTGVMQTRMIPVEGIFSRFKRIVRDIAKDLGKQVSLRIEGEDTELDKNIVEKLADPLTHMIRNAVDHGIEDVRTRQQAGKAAEGTLVLSAAHRGNTIWISLSDDGRGLNKEKICATALKKGLLSAEQVERMNDEEKFDLIFMPGFSTADSVTSLSGRGVGMDVVKTMINSVNGALVVQSAAGQGTTIILKIPLTLAIIQALLVTVGAETYAFPLEAVTEIIRAAPTELYSVDGNLAVKLRDRVLSLIDLRQVIKISAPAPAAEERGAKLKIVVISDGYNHLGVIVDALVGEEEIVIKALSEHFAQVKGISGASILGDGTVALILDPVGIVKEA